MSKSFSGKRVADALVRVYGFRAISQRGSHLKLRKHTADGGITTIVPMHRELAIGTLRGVLRLARIEFDDFMKNV